MTTATYIGTTSAQFAPGTRGHLSDATRRRVWFSLRPDGGEGCFVHPSDVADGSQVDRAREVVGERSPCPEGAAFDDAVLAAAREIVAQDLADDRAISSR